MRFAGEPSREKAAERRFYRVTAASTVLCDNCNESVDINIGRCYSIDTN